MKPPAKWATRSVLAVSAVLVAGIAAAPAAFAVAGPLSNGGFEDVQLPAGGSGYQTVDATNQASWIGPWKVSAGNVDLVSSAYWQPAEGTQSLDLSGSSAGNITQDVATIAGHTYEVDFAYTANPDGPPSTKDLQVSLGGMSGSTATGNFFPTITGVTHADMHWQHGSITGVATASHHILTFRNLSTSTPYGPVIDAVTITDLTVATVLPEAPAAGLLAGAGLVAVAGVGLYRRKQA